MLQVVSFIFIVYSGVDVRPLTPGLGPSHMIWVYIG